MAWIEIHQEIGCHPKTRKLARRLDVSIPTAVGHLHLLWHWAMDFAEDGNLAGFDSWELADAAMWEGDADEFGDALRAVGFIDDTDQGPVIHDWHDYAGKLIQRRREDAERKRKARQKPDNPPPPDDRPNVSTGHPPDVRTPSDVTVPYRAEPYPIGEANASLSPTRPRNGSKPQGPTLTPEQAERFERWYTLYPRQENRARAEAAFAEIDPDDALVNTMIATTKRYAASDMWQSDGGQFIPHPARWLNDERWNDAPPKAKSSPNSTVHSDDERVDYTAGMEKYRGATIIRTRVD